MKSIIALALIAGFGLAGAAFAAPQKLNKDQMDKITAGAITPTKVNGGGNTPGGNANGVPTVNLNPAGDGRQHSV
jgi:hypothetical protein